MSQALDLIGLRRLMALTTGDSSVSIGLIDGPVDMRHTGISSCNIRAIGPPCGVADQGEPSEALLHGTYIAGILAGKREASCPSICPDCPLLVRSILPVHSTSFASSPPEELAAAILDCIKSGARLINLSAAANPRLSSPSSCLDQALDYAAAKGVIVVAATGNDGLVGTSAITRHPWVIPVVAYSRQGLPLGFSNLGARIGRNGIGAPGQQIQSLRAGGKSMVLSGTSPAAAIVTGAIALLWSLYPRTSPTLLRRVLVSCTARNQRCVVPPILNLHAAQRALEALPNFKD